jgi:tetrahydromethanopterin S-methyltransferase subunit B
MADEFNKEVCERRHEQVKEKLEHHDKWLGEHEKKIDILEKSDATNTNEIKNLCKGIENQNVKIGNLTNAIWGLVAGLFLAMVGFLFWYIQSLPRR